MRCLLPRVFTWHHWAPNGRVCVDSASTSSSGAINDLPDAWLAAATIHLGEHLVSFDRAFKRLIGRSQFTLLEPEVP